MAGAGGGEGKLWLICVLNAGAVVTRASDWTRSCRGVAMAPYKVTVNTSSTIGAEKLLAIGTTAKSRCAEATPGNVTVIM